MARYYYLLIVAFACSTTLNGESDFDNTGSWGSAGSAFVGDPQKILHKTIASEHDISCSICNRLDTACWRKCVPHHGWSKGLIDEGNPQFGSSNE